MKLKRTVSIEDFENVKFKIELVEENEEKAILTHYLQNYKASEKKYFEQEALSSFKVSDPQYE